MAVEFKVNENTLTAVIYDEIDHHKAADLRQLIDMNIKNLSPKKLVIDFSNVSFMDSSGIGLILGRYKVMSKMGGKISVRGSNSYIKKIIDMSGINSLIERE